MRPTSRAVHSEANTRRINIVEQCFGSAGEVGGKVLTAGLASGMHGVRALRLTERWAWTGL